MTTALLIGWGVVATLCAAFFFVMWRATKDDARCWRKLYDEQCAEMWADRGKSAATFREMAERIWKLEDANAELRLGPRTATTRNQP
jgi:hypothetical protein